MKIRNCDLVSHSICLISQNSRYQFYQLRKINPSKTTSPIEAQGFVGQIGVGASGVVANHAATAGIVTDKEGGVVPLLNMRSC